MSDAPSSDEALTLPSTAADGPGPIESDSVYPRVVSRYVLLEKIGKGGRGVVYRAYDPMLARFVAVKLVRPSSRDESEDVARERLVREAQAIAQLAHPNVISVYDVGTYDSIEFEDADGPDRKGVYIVMELVPGPTLRQWVAKGKPDWDAIRRIFLQAGRGLAAAHASGLVHRDFKPSNVIVGDDGRVRVLDFGLARAATVQTPSSDAAAREIPELRLEDGSSSGAHAVPSPSPLAEPLTQAGMVLGTPPYMAPEQHFGREVDARSDQYSFCVALYEAMFGKRPFEHKDFRELARTKYRGDFRMPTSPRIPERIVKVIERGLKPWPEDRFASMEELLDQLAIDLRARRRRLLVGGLGLAVVGSVVGGTTWSRHHAEQVCDEATRDLGGAWDAETRTAVAAAFDRDPRGFTGALLAYVNRTLDEYAAQWSAQARADCLDRRGERTPDDERSLCLELGRQTVEMVTARLIDGDPRSLERSEELVHQLEPLEVCERRERSRPRSGRHSREWIEQTVAMRAMLLEAEIEATILRFGRARGLARDVLTAASDADDRPLAAGALLVLARVAEPEERLGLFERAWAEAEGALDGRIAIEALAFLALELSSVERDYASTRRLAAVLEQKLETLEHEPLTKARAYDALARVMADAGQRESAREAMRNSLALYERELGPDSPRLFPGLLWTYYDASAEPGVGDPDQILARAQRILDEGLGPQHPHQLSVLSARSGAAWRRGETGEALQVQHRAVELCEETYGPRDLRVAHHLDLLGDIMVARGDFGDAIKAKRRSLEIRLTTFAENHPTVARSRAKLAMGLLNADRAEEALREIDMAIDAFPPEARAKPSQELTEHLNRRGFVLEELGRHEEALSAFDAVERAWARFAPDVGADATIRMAVARGAKGRQHCALDQLGPGTALLESALVDLSLLEPHDQKKARVQFELAVCIADSEPARALELAQAAQAAFRRQGTTNRHTRRIDAWLAEHGPRGSGALP